MGLTPRQEKFAQEFVLTGNASEAYRRAYPKSLDWKPESVSRKASELLGTVKVSARVAELQKEVKEKFDISAERLLLEQSRIALFDHRRLFDDKGNLLPPSEMPDDVAASVAGVKILHRKIVEGENSSVESAIIEVKLWNKNTALDSLFKNKGLYEKDNRLNVNVEGTLAEVLRRLDRKKE